MRREHDISPADSEEGWRLIDLEEEVRRWMIEFWDEVRLESVH